MLRKWLPIRSLKLAMLAVALLGLAFATAIESPAFDASLNWLLLIFVLFAFARALAERPLRKTFWIGFLVFVSAFVYLERSYFDHASYYSLYSPAIVAGQTINHHEFGDVISTTVGPRMNDAITQPSGLLIDEPTPLTKHHMLLFQIASQKSQQAHERALPIVVIAIGFLGGYLCQWLFPQREPIL